MNGTRAVRTGLAAALLLAAAAGCGGDSDGDDGASSDAGGSETAAETPSVEEVKACLEEGGIDTSGESNLPPALMERDGIVDVLVLNGDGDLVGMGGVTLYVDDDAAQKAYEAGGAVRTEDVARGVKGNLDYDYAGSDAAVELIESCLE